MKYTIENTFEYSGEKETSFELINGVYGKYVYVEKYIDLDKLLQLGDCDSLMKQTDLLNETIKKIKNELSKKWNELEPFFQKIENRDGSYFMVMAERHQLKFRFHICENKINLETSLNQLDELVEKYRREHLTYTPKKPHPDRNVRMKNYLNENELKLKSVISSSTFHFLENAKIIDVFEETSSFGTDYEVILEYKGEQIEISFMKGFPPEISNDIGLKKDDIRDIEIVYAKVPVFWDN